MKSFFKNIAICFCVVIIQTASLVSSQVHVDKKMMLENLISQSNREYTERGLSGLTLTRLFLHSNSLDRQSYYEEMKDLNDKLKTLYKSHGCLPNINVRLKNEWYGLGVCLYPNYYKFAEERTLFQGRLCCLKEELRKTSGKNSKSQTRFNVIKNNTVHPVNMH